MSTVSYETDGRTAIAPAGAPAASPIRNDPGRGTVSQRPFAAGLRKARIISLRRM